MVGWPAAPGGRALGVRRQHEHVVLLEDLLEAIQQSRPCVTFDTEEVKAWDPSHHEGNPPLAVSSYRCWNLSPAYLT
jgi:hypothetical protein